MVSGAGWAKAIPDATIAQIRRNLFELIERIKYFATEALVAAMVELAHVDCLLRFLRDLPIQRRTVFLY